MHSPAKVSSMVNQRIGRTPAIVVISVMNGRCLVDLRFLPRTPFKRVGASPARSGRQWIIFIVIVRHLQLEVDDAASWRSGVEACDGLAGIEEPLL